MHLFLLMNFVESIRENNNRNFTLEYNPLNPRYDEHLSTAFGGC
jgi:hypothetical protein